MNNGQVVTAELVGKFLKNLPNQFQKIQYMLSVNDTFTALDRVRIIGSMSRTFKLDMMTDCICEIERLLEVNRPKQAIQMLKEAELMAADMIAENTRQLENSRL